MLIGPGKLIDSCCAPWVCLGVSPGREHRGEPKQAPAGQL